MTSDEHLDTEIISAHHSHDICKLVKFYQMCAQRAEKQGQMDECCFFLTQAYVFALEAGDPAQHKLRHKLEKLGRL